MDLNALMDFDHVITVHADGAVTDGPSELYAPSILDGELDDSRWELLTGYSGQFGYPGPIMHNSEFVGGGLARDILANPGTYVVVVAYWSPDEDSLSDDESVAEGWAVARLRD